ncbi:hypothetical protein [Sphingomonas colocasiae]|uniref:Argininosuccinate lyase n=1 Tax=Sphingomonas colocasiae TaxID=1848973 RepID=A0ABS7PK34_9SPHN|nr:hypothetical protein [Sphingomonas colocasiae]MBY8821646.1 hypothetical protein [Sphingomonas colocasiae]
MRIVLLLTAAAATLSLAACGSKEPEAPALENNVVEMPEDLTPVNETPPAENLTNEVTPAAPPPAFTDDEQMRDDADATGLTARLPRSDTEAPVANEAAER